MDEILEKIKSNLGENYIEGTQDVLEDILEDITSIACDVSNREKTDKKLFPYIKKAVRSEYLTRGAEGLLSNSESGVSSSFEDIVEKMRNDIVKNGVRRPK